LPYNLTSIKFCTKLSSYYVLKLSCRYLLFLPCLLNGLPRKKLTVHDHVPQRHSILIWYLCGIFYVVSWWIFKEAATCRSDTRVYYQQNTPVKIYRIVSPTLCQLLRVAILREHISQRKYLFNLDTPVVMYRVLCSAGCEKHFTTSGCSDAYRT